MVVDPSDEKHIVVGAEEQFGFESFNGGLTWSNLATRAGNDTADPSTRCTATYNHAAYGFAQGFYCHNQSGIIDRSRAAGFIPCRPAHTLSVQPPLIY